MCRGEGGGEAKGRRSVHQASRGSVTDVRNVGQTSGTAMSWISNRSGGFYSGSSARTGSRPTTVTISSWTRSRSTRLKWTRIAPSWRRSCSSSIWRGRTPRWSTSWTILWSRSARSGSAPAARSCLSRWRRRWRTSWPVCRSRRSSTASTFTGMGRYRDELQVAISRVCG